MRATRALSVLVPLALLIPVGVAAPAVALAPVGTVLTITDSPDPAIYYDEIGPKTADVVQHKGKLTTTEGEPVAGAVVELWQKLAGGEWQKFDFEEDIVTNDNGVYAVATRVEGNAWYQVTYEGDGSTYESSTSPLETFKAMRDFNAELVEKKQSAVLKGNINPGWENKVVHWQKRTCKSCAWKQIDKERSGDNGSWSFTAQYPPKIGKKWFYRAVIDGTPEFIKSVSATLTTSTVPADRAQVARLSSR